MATPTIVAKDTEVLERIATVPQRTGFGEGRLRPTSRARPDNTVRKHRHRRKIPRHADDVYGVIRKNRGRESPDLIRTSPADVLEPFSASKLEPRGQRTVALTGLAAAECLGYFATPSKRCLSRLSG